MVAHSLIGVGMRHCPYDEIQTEEERCFSCNRPTTELHESQWHVGEFGYRSDDIFAIVREAALRTDANMRRLLRLMELESSWNPVIETPAETARRIQDQ